MPRRSYLTNLIEAEDLTTGMTDQGEPVDVVYLDFPKAFDLVCHRLLVKKMVAIEINLKITRWEEEFLKNRTFRVKLKATLRAKVSYKAVCLRALSLGAVCS